jgi:NAD dependent epimerase/dehydratase family enzyme
MENKKICIMGATSHIAKGLIYSFLNNTDDFLYLFARNTNGVKSFLKSSKFESDKYEVLTFDRLHDFHFDVIINCVGIADPGKQKDAGSSIFFITETFDNMILDYLNDHADTLYINFSSGAVYGAAFDKPVDYNSSSEINVNKINEKDYYRVAKLYSETKHRSLKEYNIVDLRVFSYFSRFVDLSTSFLMTEIVNVIKKDDMFITSNLNIVRDYIHLSDLFALVNCCIKKKNLNDVFDVYSKAPIEKFDLLNILKMKFGLKFKIEDSVTIVNSTGLKSVYYSENRYASSIGYEPMYNSIETITSEIDEILYKQ